MIEAAMNTDNPSPRFYSGEDTINASVMTSNDKFKEKS